MKKIILSLLIVIPAITTFAQESKTNIPTDEIRVDGLKLIRYTALEVHYENVTDKDTGYGASLLINPFNQGPNNELVSITPFYRVYFLNKEDYGAKGFFVEAFSDFHIGAYEYYDMKAGEITSIEETLETDKYFDIALGMGLGKKWIHRKNYIFEISGGVGKVLGLSKYSNEFLGKLNLSVGYRF